MRKAVTSQYMLILMVSALITLFYNGSFFARFTDVFPFDPENAPFVVAAGLLLYFILVLLFAIPACKYITKPLLMLSVIVAAVVSYYMAEYGAVIDTTMIQNIIETNAGETLGLVSVEMVVRLALLGILPAWFILKWNVTYQAVGREILSKVLIITLSLAASGVLLMSFSASFTSFFREYVSVRYYTNPVTAFYSGIIYVGAALTEQERPEHPEIVSRDAKIVHRDADIGSGKPGRELVILVVGEAVRADHLQLNGYPRETSPRLSRVGNLVSFTQFTSCGTSTAVSLPCMFLKDGRKEFDPEDVYRYENVLDVLKRSGVNVLWRENNSSSKGVADRIEYQNYRRPDVNPVCDTECRDSGMLSGLQEYIDRKTEGSILIVLHQKGNHGPEYYKRYPESFEYFKPTCKTNKLGECTVNEINNAYDNVIRYTDSFLAKTIQLLKGNDASFETSMLYVSDHGESLGEKGFYLHGLPYAIAPEAQKHVAAILWAGEYFDVGFESIRNSKDKPWSHDNLYCTLLGMFEVEIKDCAPDMSMFYDAPG